MVETAARYVQKADGGRELAEVPHDLRLALSVQVVVGASESKQCINLFKIIIFWSVSQYLHQKKSKQASSISNEY